MEIVVLNGSPRKNFNTAKMLRSMADGVKSVIPDINVHWVDVYDLHYRGCISCFGCKLKNSKTYGTCVVKDDLQDVFAQINACDGLIIGSPIYESHIAAYLGCLLERLLFSHTTYEVNYPPVNAPKIPTCMIYTMNLHKEEAEQWGYGQIYDRWSQLLSNIFTLPSTSVKAYNTYQFRDYSRYVVTAFSEPEKAAYRDEHFPEELKAAFDEGVSMANTILNNHA